MYKKKTYDNHVSSAETSEEYYTIPDTTPECLCIPSTPLASSEYYEEENEEEYEEENPIIMETLRRVVPCMQPRELGQSRIYQRNHSEYSRIPSAPLASSVYYEEENDTPIMETLRGAIPCIQPREFSQPQIPKKTRSKKKSYEEHISSAETSEEYYTAPKTEHRRCNYRLSKEYPEYSRIPSKPLASSTYYDEEDEEEYEEENPIIMETLKRSYIQPRELSQSRTSRRNRSEYSRNSSAPLISSTYYEEEDDPIIMETLQRVPCIQRREHSQSQNPGRIRSLRRVRLNRRDLQEETPVNKKNFARREAAVSQ